MRLPLTGVSPPALFRWILSIFVWENFALGGFNMSGEKYVIGVDFGTLSGRAVLVEAKTGRVVVQEECPYRHGILPQLPGGPPLDHGWAIQDPDDYLQVLEETIPALLRRAGVSGEQVAGLGCDVTSCTILPTARDGTPLCRLKEYHRQPHAYAKLWKHHGAVRQAERIEVWTREKYPDLLRRYGGRVSSQWLLPKVLQLLEEAPEVYQGCDLILEMVDWLSFQLTGQLRRNACCAGFKSFWTPGEGYPPANFFTGLDTRLADLLPKKLRGEAAAPWESVGQLTPEWARRLGLTIRTQVSAGIIDAHAGVLGSGVTEAGRMVMVLGTSACHLLLSPEERMVPGICGSCRDGILPGFYAYEAGQACVGDMLEWLIRSNISSICARGAELNSQLAHQTLTRQAGLLRPGESGLLALDWWNGQRTPLVNNRLTGVMVGLTLSTTVAEQYRALLEAAAFGGRTIVEVFEKAGLGISEVTACGGIARKNPLMMQIYADVLDRPIRVAASDQCPALGAAALAAAAAGLFQSPLQAVSVISSPRETLYVPQPENAAVYQILYRQYQALTRCFSAGGMMDELTALRKSGRGRAFFSK